MTGLGGSWVVGGCFGVLALPACFGSSDSGGAPDSGVESMDAGAEAEPIDTGASLIDATTGDASSIEASSPEAGASTADAAAPADASAPRVAPGIYVTSSSPDSVLVFAPGASGNVAPVRTISGVSTGLSTPIGIGVDSQGSVYVANREGGSVTVYPALANGDVAPVRTLTASGMSAPEGIVVAPGDDVFVSTCPGCGGSGDGDTGIYHFPPQSPQTDRIIGGATNASTLLTDPGSVALDESEDLWVGNSFGGTVSLFAGGATGDVAPMRIFQPTATNLQAIAYGNGTVFVADPGAGIDEYAATATGTATPASTIAASALSLAYPGQIAIDTSVTPPVLYVVDYSASAIYVVQTAGTAPNLTVASVATLRGNATTLNMPLGIAVVP